MLEQSWQWACESVNCLEKSSSKQLLTMCWQCYYTIWLLSLDFLVVSIFLSWLQADCGLWYGIFSRIPQSCPTSICEFLMLLDKNVTVVCKWGIEEKEIFLLPSEFKSGLRSSVSLMSMSKKALQSFGSKCQVSKISNIIDSLPEMTIFLEDFNIVVNAVLFYVPFVLFDNLRE